MCDPISLLPYSYIHNAHALHTHTIPARTHAKYMHTHPTHDAYTDTHTHHLTLQQLPNGEDHTKIGVK